MKKFKETKLNKKAEKIKMKMANPGTKDGCLYKLVFLRKYYAL